MQYGAVTTAFFVFQDLLHYQGGIYKHESGVKVGGHAITVVGWGREEQSGRDYWIV
jgi:cathepsin B